MENYSKGNKRSFIIYLDTNNLYGGTISQKLPVNGLKWKKMSKINKKIVSRYDGKV